jgi:hypothetical protein
MKQLAPNSSKSTMDKILIVEDNEPWRIIKEHKVVDNIHININKSFLISEELSPKETRQLLPPSRGPDKTPHTEPAPNRHERRKRAKLARQPVKRMKQRKRN